jgi:hypothetical protein
MNIQSPFGLGQNSHMTLAGAYVVHRATDERKDTVQGSLKFDNSGQSDQTVQVDVGQTVESIQLAVSVEYSLMVVRSDGDTFHQGFGKFGFSATWRAVSSDKGLELVPDGTQPRSLGPATSREDIMVGATARMVASIPADKRPFVELVVVLVAGDEGQVSPGLQGNLPSNTTVYRKPTTGPFGFTIRLNLDIKAAPKAVIKKQTVVIGSFDFGDFSIKKIKAISGMLDYGKFSAWYNGLPERTRNIIEQDQKPPGGKMIVMTGFTDNVGDEFNNFELGKKRAIAAAEMFEKLSGVSWKKIITPPSKGEQDIRQEDKRLEKKDPKHRRVEVTMFVEE